MLLMLAIPFPSQLLSEFSEACQRAAIAITEGHVLALNLNDPERSHVYVFNNIFFSRAMDTKDFIKVERLSLVQTD